MSATIGIFSLLPFFLLMRTYFKDLVKILNFICTHSFTHLLGWPSDSHSLLCLLRRSRNDVALSCESICHHSSLFSNICTSSLTIGTSLLTINISSFTVGISFSIPKFSVLTLTHFVAYTHLPVINIK